MPRYPVTAASSAGKAIPSSTLLQTKEGETMGVQRHITMKSGFLAAAAVLAMFAFGSYASATVVRINFGGTTGSGHADLTLGATNPADVVDASRPPLTITDASGMFNGMAITGVHALNHAVPPPGEVLPAAYSLFSIPGYGDHEGVSYDNLFYPYGSPLICLIDGTPVYPFSGGLLDLMGVMFELDGGNLLDLWSMGDTAPGFFFPSWPGGLTYGMKMISPTTAGGYAVVSDESIGVAVAVPEPDYLWLFGAAVIGLFAWRRSVESRKAPRVA
jgi:hypothetical protein